MKTKEGLWKLSPSGLYAYTKCKTCFWIENNYKKPSMLPLLLNSATDDILKTRYDKYRIDGIFPPEAQELEKEGIKPFTDIEMLKKWRNETSILKVINAKVGYELQGKIDDVFIEADGRFVPIDYKSSGNPPKEDKRRYYRDQLAAYGFMFKRHNYEVSNRAYLLHYFVKNKNDPSINVKFNSYVDLVKIDLDEIEKKLENMVRLLNGSYPGYNEKCDKCLYHKGLKQYQLDY